MRLILILGMHRSGTSCLTGSLEAAGLHLGEVNTKAPYNAKGNRENRDIMELHDQVLANVGAAWDKPPQVRVDWLPEQRSKRDSLIQSLFASPALGLKDPRMLLLIEDWLEHYPEANLVGTFRHPYAVAASLTARNNYNRQRGCRLWWQYNQKLLQLRNRLSFPLISFDAPSVQYKSKLVDIATHCDLPAPEAATDFFNGQLRQQKIEEWPLEDDLATTYEKLLDYAEVG